MNAVSIVPLVQGEISMTKDSRNLIIFGVVVALLLLVPIPLRSGDGSVRYQAGLYSVSVYNAETGQDGYMGHLVGTQISILFINVFDNTEFVPDESVAAP